MACWPRAAAARRPWCREAAAALPLRPVEVRNEVARARGMERCAVCSDSTEWRTWVLGGDALRGRRRGRSRAAVSCLARISSSYARRGDKPTRASRRDWRCGFGLDGAQRRDKAGARGCARCGNQLVLKGRAWRPSTRGCMRQPARAAASAAHAPGRHACAWIERSASQWRRTAAHGATQQPEQRQRAARGGYLTELQCAFNRASEPVCIPILGSFF